MLKKIELLIMVLLLAGLVFINKNVGKFVTSDQVKIQRKTVVLDAGHGGEDPGKVGVNGILEKDINLQIAKIVKGYLEERGFFVVMTREDDRMLCTDNVENKKREDMNERVKIINENHSDLAVSIHQNSFSDPEAAGAQAFYYSGSEEGKRIAERIQKALTELDEKNTRQAKDNNNYFLLKHTKVPTVIVECGFLSNMAEAEKLKTTEYQDLISIAIVNGIESCFGN